MKPTVTVDIGTTRVKLCFFDAAGQLRASRKLVTPTKADEWGVVYDVESLLAMITDFISRLDDGDKSSVERIAVAGVGESGGLVGPDLQLRSPMILWHDHRGSAFLDRMGPEERSSVYPVTGLPVNANYALSKIAWAVAHAGDAAHGAKWLNVSEFIAAHMTGRRWAEYSLASRTMALDLTTRQWSPEMCAIVGIEPSVFPELRSAARGARVSQEYSKRVRLDPSVEVHVVGHDHMVGGVGADLRPGEMLNSTGTTEGLLVLRDRPALDHDTAATKLANGVACDGVDFTLFASIPTGGSAFETLQRMLGMSLPALIECVAALDGRYVSGGIELSSIPLVIPQFRGSPPPEKSGSAKGLIANIGSDVSAEDIVFGCFLGMAFQFRKVLELFPARPGSIKVIGPASENALWLHLKADVLGTDLSVSKVDEVVSRGAQALASGEQGDWRVCQPSLVEADIGRHARLEEWHEAMQPTMKRLANLSW